jgi:hypothetical protein
MKLNYILLFLFLIWAIENKLTRFKIREGHLAWYMTPTDFENNQIFQRVDTVVPIYAQTDYNQIKNIILTTDNFNYFNSKLGLMAEKNKILESKNTN